MNRRLLRLILGSALMALPFAGGVVQAQQFFNAHYQISVNDSVSQNTVSSTFRLRPGAKKQLDMWPNIIELDVQPISNTAYDLVMVVMSKAAGAIRLAHTFRGTFGEPLELAANAESIRVSGAISVVILDEKQGIEDAETDHL